MRKIIDNKIHGTLDYVTVASFALIPTVFTLSGVPAYLSYILAVVHLLMTVLTDFNLGFVKIIPLNFHKYVEMAVGPILVVIPWVLNFSQDIKARSIFIVAGIVIIAVGQLSEYKPKSFSKT